MHLKIIDKRRYVAALLAVLLLACAGVWGMARAGGEEQAPAHAPCVATTLPTDPFQRCATKALAGDYGPLPAWKRAAYQRGIEQGVTVAGWAWRTSYYPWEGSSGRVDASGKPCTMRTAAANLIPRGSYVWIDEPGQMRQVLDCGARYNDRVARSKGARLWIDSWERVFCENTVTLYAVITAE